MKVGSLFQIVALSFPNLLTSNQRLEKGAAVRIFHHAPYLCSSAQLTVLRREGRHRPRQGKASVLTCGSSC